MTVKGYRNGRPQTTERVNWNVSIEAGKLIRAASRMEGKSQGAIISSLVLSNLSGEEHVRRQLQEIITKQDELEQERIRLQKKLAHLRGAKEAPRNAKPSDRYLQEIKNRQIELNTAKENYAQAIEKEGRKK